MLSSTNPVLEDLDTGIIDNIYKKTETFGMSLIANRCFDLKTVNALVLFLEAEIGEIREELHVPVKISVIKRFYVCCAKGKNNDNLRNGLNNFMEGGLEYYINMISGTYPLFNYYIITKWLSVKFGVAVSFFKRCLNRQNTGLCENCKMPIKPDNVTRDSNTIQTEIIRNEHTTPVASQMEVIPEKVAESVLPPVPLALSQENSSSSVTMINEAVLVPGAIPDKM